MDFASELRGDVVRGDGVREVAEGEDSATIEIREDEFVYELLSQRAGFGRPAEREESFDDLKTAKTCFFGQRVAKKVPSHGAQMSDGGGVLAGTEEETPAPELSFRRLNGLTEVEVKLYGLLEVGAGGRVVADVNRTKADGVVYGCAVNGIKVTRRGEKKQVDLPRFAEALQSLKQNALGNAAHDEAVGVAIFAEECLALVHDGKGFVKALDFAESDTQLKADDGLIVRKGAERFEKR